jgi:hypothetical protein
MALLGSVIRENNVATSGLLFESITVHEQQAFCNMSPHFFTKGKQGMEGYNTLRRMVV